MYTYRFPKLFIAIVAGVAIAVECLGLGVASESCLRPPLRWNPPPLGRGFWKPVVDTTDENVRQEQCQRASCLKLDGAYGRSNNILVRFFHELLLASALDTPMAYSLSGSDTEMDSILSRFPGALEKLQNWACIRKDCTTWETHSAEDLFYLRDTSKELHDHKQSGAVHQFHNPSTNILNPTLFSGAVFSQILLNANEKIKQDVDKFAKEHNFYCGRYAVLHLRGLEGSCERRITEQAHFHKNKTATTPDYYSVEGVHWFTPKEICSSSDRFIQTYNPDNLPLMLMHDGQDMSRVSQITSTHKALIFPGRDMWAEIILAVRADVFIRNPMSSMSSNIIAARLFLGTQIF
eukprot:m.29029 g.29029  ORF g.29029 m.29029 type:complete len:349 (-) comp16025_c0_seq1:23-1069(-)